MLRPVLVLVVRHAAAAAALEVGPRPRGPRFDVGDAAAALRGEFHDEVDATK